MEGVVYVLKKKKKKSIFYPGSTNSFESRRRDHKYNSFNPSSGKWGFPVYQYIRDTFISFDEVEMTPVDKCQPGYEEIYEAYLIKLMRSFTTILNSKSPPKIDLTSKSTIYKITKFDKIVYIGSSHQFLERKKQHKREAYDPKSDKYDKCPLYKHARSINQETWPDCLLFDVIESCLSVVAKVRETHYMKYYKTKVDEGGFNKCYSFITKEELREAKRKIDDKWYADNKEEINKKREIYRKNNPEKIQQQKEKRKQKTECELCGKKISRYSMKNHLDLVCSKNPNKNDEKIKMEKEKRKEKIECELCGKNIKIYGMKAHLTICMEKQRN